MEQGTQLRQFVHLPQDEDIGPLNRSYRVREGRLEHNGREILYIMVETTNVTFCDGSYASRLQTVNVEGYITRWKYKTNENGEAISELEPIDDKETQSEIRKILKKEYISNINF